MDQVWEVVRVSWPFVLILGAQKLGVPAAIGRWIQARGRR